MSLRFVRSQVSRIVVLSAIVLATACGGGDIGSARLKALKTGDKLSHVVDVMGQGPFTAMTASDSLRIVSGYRLQKFLAKGTMHEVIWYRDSTGSIESPITKTAETPVVIVGDTLVGWGWKFFDKYAQTNGLPNPSRDAARLDSMGLTDSIKKPGGGA